MRWICGLVGVLMLARGIYAQEVPRDAENTRLQPFKVLGLGITDIPPKERLLEVCDFYNKGRHKKNVRNIVKGKGGICEIKNPGATINIHFKGRGFGYVSFREGTGDGTVLSYLTEKYGTPQELEEFEMQNGHGGTIPVSKGKWQFTDGQLEYTWFGGVGENAKFEVYKEDVLEPSEKTF